MKAAQHIRAKACECAALALAGRREGEPIIPLAWSLTVFFEQYICEGAEGTREDFGPKEPVHISIVAPEL